MFPCLHLPAGASLGRMSSSNCLRPHLLGFFSAPAAIVRLWPAHRDAPVNPTLFPATPGVAADLCWFAQTTWSTLSLSSRPYSGYQFRFLLSSGDLSLRSPITLFLQPDLVLPAPRGAACCSSLSQNLKEKRCGCGHKGALCKITDAVRCMELVLPRFTKGGLLGQSGTLFLLRKARACLQF